MWGGGGIIYNEQEAGCAAGTEEFGARLREFYIRKGEAICDPFVTFIK